MNRGIHKRGRFKGLALALAVSLAFLVEASPSQAEVLTFINDTKAPLVVQLATATRGGILRDRPYQVLPGEKVRISLPGNKLLNIFDVRMPNRPLFQGTMQALEEDKSFSIKVDPRAPLKVIVEPVPAKK